MKRMLCVLLLAIFLFPGCQKAANPESEDSGPVTAASENRKYTLDMYLKIQMNNTYEEVREINPRLFWAPI
jgi:hypothetical protein